MTNKRKSWKLPLTAVMTTSAIAMSEAFVPTSVSRTPLHVNVPCHHQQSQAEPLTPPRIPTKMLATSTPSCSMDSLTSSDLRSFLGSDSERISLQQKSRYGGRTTGSIDESAVYSDFGDDLKRNRAVLGFDLKMVSRSMDSSDLPTLEDSDGVSRSTNRRSTSQTSSGIRTTFGLKIEKLNNPSPVKRRVAANLQSRHAAEKSQTTRDTFEDMTNSFMKPGDKEISNCVPGWFPYLPTKSQVERLKVYELKDACQDRGLPKSGNKADLQNRLVEWTNVQHRRRVFERNAMHTFPDSPIQDAINSALFRTGIPESADEIETPECTFDATSGSIDCIQPLINRRMELLRSNQFSFSKSKGSLGFHIDEEDDAEDGRTESMTDDVIPTEQYLSDLKKTFDKNVDETPNNYQVKLLYQQAKHADQVGNFESAKFYLNQLRVVTPKDTRVIRRLARLEMQDGKIHEARKFLQSGLRTMPKNGDLLQGLGQLEAKCGNTDRARQYFKDAISASPDFANPYHALGTLEHSEGNIKVATTILRLGLKHCPSNHRLHHALGDLYREAKMLDMAEKAYNKGLKCIDIEAQHTGRRMDWGKSFFYTAMSYLSYDRGNIDESRKWLHRSVELADNEMHSQGWLGLAQLEESENNIERARDVYTKALDVYEKRRNITKPRSPAGSRIAREKIKPAKLGDKWIDVYESWARLEQQAGTYSDANNIYSRAATAFPKEWRVLVNWARLQSKHNKIKRARTLFELACDIAGSSDATPYRLYAEYEMASGNYMRARSILILGAQSLSESSHGSVENDGFARLYHTWAVCEWYLGNLERTEVLFDHSLRLTDSALGSDTRSLVLYSFSRFFFHARKDCTLAQHCISLSLAENSVLNNKSDIWSLWADVAKEMSNLGLSEQCLSRARELPSLRQADSSLFSSGVQNHKMNHMLRRAPWQYKILKSGPDDASWYRRVTFPDPDNGAQSATTGYQPKYQIFR